jgi:hypothetical protein
MTFSCELHHIHHIHILAGPSSFLLVLVWACQKSPPIQGQQFGYADELLSEVRKILNEISFEALEVVFWDWINELNRYIAALQQMEITGIK